MNGNQDNLNQKAYASDMENVTTVDIYRSEIQRLLDDRPELLDYQQEIERRLAHAGTFQNRMAVLGIMMEDKLTQLQHHLTSLAEKVQTKI